MPRKPVDPRVELGRRLQEARLKAGLTVSGLAGAMISDQSNIRKIENGTGNPTTLTLLKLAGVLEVRLEDLVRDLDPSALPPEERPVPYSKRDPRFWRPSDRIS